MKRAYRPRRVTKRRRPPRRMAACGHWVYAWRDRERCNACLELASLAEPEGESLREFRQRLKGEGLLS